MFTAVLHGTIIGECFNKKQLVKLLTLFVLNEVIFNYGLSFCKEFLNLTQYNAVYQD